MTAPPEPTACLDNETVLAFVQGRFAGEANAAQAARIDEHLARCSDCRKLVAEAYRSAQVLSEHHVRDKTRLRLRATRENLERLRSLA